MSNREKRADCVPGPEGCRGCDVATDAGAFCAVDLFMVWFIIEDRIGAVLPCVTD